MHEAEKEADGGTKMNRLTVRTPEGAALKMEDIYLSEDAAREALMAKFRIAVERLAAYEDTGLEPAEIQSEIDRRRACCKWKETL